MATAGGYSVLQLVQGSAAEPYQIRRSSRDGVLYCTCRGWVVSKNSKVRPASEPPACKHVKEYVSDNPFTNGMPTTYGPPGMFSSENAKHGIGQAASAPAYASRAEQRRVEAGMPAGKRPVAQTGPSGSLQPARSNFKEYLLNEQKAAESRGVKTPAAALAAFSVEVAQFAHLDISGGEVVVGAVDGSAFRNLEVE